MLLHVVPHMMLIAEYPLPPMLLGPTKRREWHPTACPVHCHAFVGSTIESASNLTRRFYVDPVLAGLLPVYHYHWRRRCGDPQALWQSQPQPW